MSGNIGRIKLTAELLDLRLVPALVTNALDYDPNYNPVIPASDPIPGSLRYAVSEARQAYLATDQPQVITFDPAVFGSTVNTVNLEYGTLGPATKYFPATDTTESYYGIDFPVTIRGPRITLGSSNELLIDESKARLNIHWSKSAFDSLQPLYGNDWTAVEIRANKREPGTNAPIYVSVQLQGLAITGGGGTTGHLTPRLTHGSVKERMPV